MTTPVAASVPGDVALRATSVYVTEPSDVETILSPPVGVDVTFVIARSGRVDVELLLTETQSLPAFGSPSTGGDAVEPPAAPAGTVEPVHAVLVAAPAVVAVLRITRSGSFSSMRISASSPSPQTSTLWPSFSRL